MLIVVDRVVDDDYCSVVNIDNQIHWLQDMSGEETPKRSSSASKCRHLDGTRHGDRFHLVSF